MGNGQSMVGKPEKIEFKGRGIFVPRADGLIAFFGFSDLCEKPLGAGDFLAIANRYRSVIISDVPIMTDTSRDAIRRFIIMIDCFYDNRIHLIVSAAAAPMKLYSGEDWRFEFGRTISRLMEMQSIEYIERARREGSLDVESSEK